VTYGLDFKYSYSLLYLLCIQKYLELVGNGNIPTFYGVPLYAGLLYLSHEADGEHLKRLRKNTQVKPAELRRPAQAL
jgi:hypothetical protein